MCSPQPQPAVKPETYGFDRRRPQCWFLAEMVLGFPHPAYREGRHCYVFPTEDGKYRLLASGVPLLVTEGVAKRHLKRLKNRQGEYVRVGQQAKWSDVWSEAFYGRHSAA